MVEEMVKRVTRRLAPKQPTTGGISSTSGGREVDEGHAEEDDNLAKGPLNTERPSTNDRDGEASKTSVVQLDSTDSEGSDTFEEIPATSAEQSVAAKYKAILSNVPRVEIGNDDIIVTKDPAKAVRNPSLQLQTPDSPLRDESVPVVKTDKEIMWEKFAEAVAKGNKVEADYFYRIYKTLATLEESTSISDKVTVATSGTLLNVAKPDILRSKSTDIPSLPTSVAKRSNEKTTIVFIKGSLPKHFDVGFTPYFDKNIREFRGPLPLTIFDKDWQEDAIQAHTNKRSRSDEKDGNYTGYEYPNEWTQTFAKWTSNHRNFYRTYKDFYNFPEFAEWILQHKANVDYIIEEHKFLTGFRYDMIIRQNAFSYQVPINEGVVSAVDISVFREDVRLRAYNVTKDLNELDFTDNPYAYGGKKFGCDPKTGRPKESKSKANEEFTGRNDVRSSSRGRGGFWARGSGDRFGMDRRNSDYGGYMDYGQDDGYKRTRDRFEEDYNETSGGYHRGYAGGGRGSFGQQGPSRQTGKRDSGSKSAKEKDPQ